jgi:hypothetical protein
MLAVTKPPPTCSMVGIIIVMLAVVFNSLPIGAAVSNFRGVSVNSDIDVSGKRRTINVVINEREMLDSYDFWKGHGLRGETTETFFRSHPYSMAAAFAFYSVVPSLHGRYRIFESFPVAVIGVMTEIDDYGHAVPHEIFSFTLTADLDAKIDWERFDAGAFQKIAPDFHYTEWFEQKFREEPLH